MKFLMELNSHLKQKNSRSGFTLLEIIVTAITIGVVTSFAISSYKTTIEQNYCRNAQSNLILIYQAQEVAISKHSTVPAHDNFSLAGLNAGYGTSIPDDPNFQYWEDLLWIGATRLNGPTYECKLQAYTMGLTRQPLSAASISCTGPDSVAYCSPILQ